MRERFNPIDLESTIPDKGIDARIKIKDHSLLASKVDISDSGSYFTGTEVESALKEIGAGTTLDTRYLKLAGGKMTGQLVSTLAIGTSPFAVTSTTVNTNLNADLLDGVEASALVPYTGASTNLDLGSNNLIGTSLIGESIQLNNVGSIDMFSDGGTTGVGNIAVGTPFIYTFGAGAGAVNANLDMTGITTSDKTFTFPDVSGTVALQSAVTDTFVIGAETLTFTNGILTGVA